MNPGRFTPLLLTGIVLAASPRALAAGGPVPGSHIRTLRSAAGSEMSVRIWNAGRGALVYTFAGRIRGGSNAFSPFVNLIATGISGGEWTSGR